MLAKDDASCVEAFIMRMMMMMATITGSGSADKERQLTRGRKECVQ